MMMDKETLLAILSEKGPFETEEDETACRELVEELSPDEVETAALTSFAYFDAMRRLKKSDGDDDQLVFENGATATTPHSVNKPQLQQQFAMREARRHYIGEDRNAERALDSLKQSLSLRMELRVDLVRLIPFASSQQSTEEGEQLSLDNITTLSDEDKDIVRQYRTLVEQEFTRQITLTGGLDRDRSGVAVRFSRLSSEADPRGYIICQIYIAERVLAAAEYHSRGTQEKVVAITEYLDYNSANAPPIWSLKDMVTQLQRLYPERLKKMILTDPPFWMRALYGLISPLLSQTTRDKMSMTSGIQEKQDALTELIGDNVSESLPLVSGEDCSISSQGVDVQEYLNQPMYQTYTPLELFSDAAACEE